MDPVKIFVSVGPATDMQEQFVRALEDRLRAEGLEPHTSGRNSWNAAAPLRAVKELMDQCAGAVVIALERSFFPAGVERRGGPAEKPLSDVTLTTPWNQMEAAMAYSRGLPLLVVVERGIKGEGMLEARYDWHVLELAPTPAALASAEFNGVLASWKRKLLEQRDTPRAAAAPATLDPAQMSLLELLGRVKIAHLWAGLVLLGGLIGGAFSLGVRLGG